MQPSFHPEEPPPERDAPDLSVRPHHILRDQHQILCPAAKLPGKLPERIHLPLRRGVGVGDVDRGQGVVRVFQDEIHLSVLFPVIGVVAPPPEFEIDQVLDTPAFIGRERERNGIPQPGIDAVDLPVVPRLHLQGVTEIPDLEEHPRHLGIADVLPDRRRLDPQHLYQLPVGVGRGDVGQEVGEEVGKRSLVAHIVHLDDIAVDDAVIVRPELIRLHALVFLLHGLRKTTLPEVLPEQVQNVVFSGGEGDRLGLDLHPAKLEVLGEVEGIDRHRQVAPADQGRDLRIEEIGGRSRDHQPELFAVIGRLDPAFPPGDRLDLVEDEPCPLSAPDVRPVGLEHRIQRHIQVDHGGLVAVDEEDRSRVDAPVLDQILDHLVQQGGLARAPDAAEDHDLPGRTIFFDRREIAVPPDAGVEGPAAPPGIEGDQEFEEIGHEVLVGYNLA